MDQVHYLYVDDDVDLVLSFSFDEGTKYGADGYCIQRTPEFESLLDEFEKGPSVDLTDDDRRILLRSATFDREKIVLQTDNGIEEFDLSELSDSDVDVMAEVLMKMNFDSIFELHDER